ncbi:MAG: nucleotidyl transferase AbiEii/AbiGii toxin family protein [Melioribacteraceae bacterium]|nr:nucleotidyl transferase AbiEii/AbiGii toxin family protein [Melioribacteraceae bacterium]MCF8266337.1 nucleotidyl transferase AbiEii/AbiGii toxin family protein [Melioribacteraceae bacterium]MCF8414567.1 nucleotidyl transferase AbiEii/AbiGii toxin family protein [Melioribacteraceae bacterium]
MSKESLITSVRQRLNKIARESQVDFNAIQLRYVQERFLYRLSKSTYQNAFILKGALLFLAYDMPSLRPTKDIDFLGSNLTNDADELEEIIKEICAIEVEDAVEFDSESVDVENITIDRLYPGLRVKVNAYMGRARITLQLDLGYGDIVVPEPVEIEFPQLLNFDAPKILSYSLESAIAEKFEACVKLNFSTSRMKDFYDIYKLASHNSFVSSRLSKAIAETFEQRGTSLDDRNIILSDDFKSDKKKQTQWKAFQNRTGLHANFDFPETVDKIKLFLEGCLTEQEKLTKWNSINWQWE